MNAVTVNPFTFGLPVECLSVQDSTIDYIVTHDDAHDAATTAQPLQRYGRRDRLGTERGVSWRLLQDEGTCQKHADRKAWPFTALAPVRFFYTLLRLPKTLDCS